MLDKNNKFKINRDNSQFYNFIQFFSSRYGIGRSQSLNICFFSGIHYGLRLGSILDNYYLTDYTNNYIVKKVQNFFHMNRDTLDDSLTKKKLNSIKNLQRLKVLKGKNHSSYLPTRGQRRRTNSNTRRKGNF